uniref:MCP four helix bundle domain-containing protein n=1 Tax=Flavobacterium sp. TaxID=239 RepID=UPI0040497955
MTFFNKIKWFLGILVIFIIVVATNLIDRNNFLRVNDAVVSIYEDRLVAKGFIYDMSEILHEKEKAVLISDSVFMQKNTKQLDEKFNSLLHDFEQTALTADEEKSIRDLKDNFDAMQKSETSFLTTKFSNKSDLLNDINKVKVNLHDLSKIQLKEGRRQMAISQKAMDMVELFTQIEIYLLIFLAIVVQIIIMYKPKSK